VKKTRKSFKTVDDYIDSYPEEVRKRLQAIRSVVRELAPEAEERISYGMPAFFLNGHLVYFAGFARHIGFFPGANGVAAFASELSKFKHAKGSIRFPLDEPLPEGLIKQIVKYKLEENTKKENATTDRTRMKTDEGKRRRKSQG
jgi:uncharacterized protein YdhG (YjbR/CyaY superfamily)